jgi:hypothetical protein
MSLPGSQHDREYQKFRDSETGAAVAIVGAGPGGSITVETAGVQWDEIVTTFPANNVEVFTYKLASVVVQIITVTYQSNDKKVPLSVVKVRP